MEKDLTAVEKKPNLWLAILCAIGIGLAGCVLYGLLYYAGYIAWLAAYIVVVGSAWGYKKFNKKMDGKGYAIITAISVIGIFLSMYFALVIVVGTKFGLSAGEAFEQVWNLVQTNSDLRVAVIRDAVLTIIFIALGILSYFFYERRLAKNNKEKEVIISNVETKSEDSAKTEEKKNDTKTETAKMVEPVQQDTNKEQDTNKKDKPKKSE